MSHWLVSSYNTVPVPPTVTVDLIIILTVVPVSINVPAVQLLYNSSSSMLHVSYSIRVIMFEAEASKLPSVRFFSLCILRVVHSSGMRCSIPSITFIHDIYQQARVPDTPHAGAGLEISEGGQSK